MQRPPRKAAFVQLRFAIFERGCLLRENKPEVAVGVIWTGGEEKLVPLAIFRRPAAEFNSPEPVDEDWLTGGIHHRADQCSSLESESVDGAVGCVVRDQQRIAERAEVCRSKGESPGLVQRFAMRQV